MILFKKNGIHSQLKKSSNPQGGNIYISQKVITNIFRMFKIDNNYLYKDDSRKGIL